MYLPELAPAVELMKTYRKDKDAAKYEAGYKKLLKERELPEGLDRKMFEEKVCCLLCSEADAAHCHRRIAAEEMKRIWGDVEIVHI